MTNLSLNLVESAEMYPDRPALRCEDATTTYQALLDDVARMARFLIDAGIEPGDRVGIILPNSVAFAVVYYGILYAGGVVRADEPPAERPRGHLLPDQYRRRGAVPCAAVFRGCCAAVRRLPARGICRSTIEASSSSSQIVCRCPARLIERSTTPR